MKDYHIPASVTIPIAVGLLGVLWLVCRRSGSKTKPQTAPKSAAREAKLVLECNDEAQSEQHQQRGEKESITISQRKIPESQARDRGGSDLKRLGVPGVVHALNEHPEILKVSSRGKMGQFEGSGGGRGDDGLTPSQRDHVEHLVTAVMGDGLHEGNLKLSKACSDSELLSEGLPVVSPGLRSRDSEIKENVVTALSSCQQATKSKAVENVAVCNSLKKQASGLEAVENVAGANSTNQEAAGPEVVEHVVSSNCCSQHSTKSQVVRNVAVANSFSQPAPESKAVENVSSVTSSQQAIDSPLVNNVSSDYQNLDLECVDDCAVSSSRPADDLKVVNKAVKASSSQQEVGAEVVEKTVKVSSIHGEVELGVGNKSVKITFNQQDVVPEIVEKAAAHSSHHREACESKILEKAAAFSYNHQAACESKVVEKTVESEIVGQAVESEVVEKAVEFEVVEKAVESEVVGQGVTVSHKQLAAFEESVTLNIVDMGVNPATAESVPYGDRNAHAGDRTADVVSGMTVPATDLSHSCDNTHGRISKTSSNNVSDQAPPPEHQQETAAQPPHELTSVPFQSNSQTFTQAQSDLEANKNISHSSNSQECSDSNTNLLEESHVHNPASQSLNLTEDRSHSLNLTEDKSHSLNLTEDKSHSLNLTEDRICSLNLTDDRSRSLNLTDDRSRSLNLTDDKSHSLNLTDDRSHSLNLTEDTVFNDSLNSLTYTKGKPGEEPEVRQLSKAWMPKASSSSVDSFSPEEIDSLWGIDSSAETTLDSAISFLDTDSLLLPTDTDVSCDQSSDVNEQSKKVKAEETENNAGETKVVQRDGQQTEGCDAFDQDGKHDTPVKSSSPVCDSNSEGSNDSGHGGSEHDTVCQGGEPLVHYDFNMPSELCGRFIGKQGKNINFLKSKTGAHVSLTNNPFTPDYQICHIVGTQAEVDDALVMIRRKFPAQDHPLLTMVPINMTPPVISPPENQLILPDVMQLSLPEGVSVEVFVSAIVDAGHVFVQQPTHRSFMSLEKLNYYLGLVYGQDPNIPNVPTPVESGIICVCENEGFWYRTMIMSSEDENGELQVKFVDYGGYAIVPVGALKQIRADFMSLPFQAVECFMANITPNNNEEFFSNEATLALSEMTQGKLLQCQVVARVENGTPYIHLYQINTETNSAVMINRALVNNHMVRWIEIL